MKQRQIIKIEELRGKYTSVTCSYLNRIYMQYTGKQIDDSVCCCPGKDHSKIIDKFYKWFDGSQSNRSENKED